VVLEPFGWEGAGTLVAAASRGTEALSVLRHDYACPRFAYAVDGIELTAFDPGLMDHVWGTEPERLRTHLRAVGLDPVDPEDGVTRLGKAAVRSVLLAAAVTGVMPPVETLTSPMLSAQFEPWFTGACPNRGALAEDPTSRDPGRNALAEAVAIATPAAKRAVAVAEARRIAGLLGVADAPGLAEALTNAENGRFPAVPMASPLGRQVRGWLRLSSTASWSANDPDGRHRMTDAERRRGNLLGWLTSVLRSALYPDPDIAVRTALYPLAFGPAPLADPAAHAAALSHLRVR
jgi:hypothetical protein